MADPTTNLSSTGSVAHLPPAAVQPSSEPSPTSKPKTARPPRPKQPSFQQIHKQPAPLRVFPFPTFTASNPISLVHLAVAWLSQVLFPPPPEPSVVHTAYWDNDTRSIIVVDEQSMTALWQQGFYGKGSLSRSEPNWLKREKIRRGALQGMVSEANTDKRREDRIRAKWERARIEQEALEQKRLEEARTAAVAEVATVPRPTVLAPPFPSAPVGPLELLALPNSDADLAMHLRGDTRASPDSVDSTEVSLADSALSGNDEADSNTTLSDVPEPKQRKSVRFSPNIQSTVFQRTDPPGPPRSASSSSLKADSKSETNGVASLEAKTVSGDPLPAIASAAETVEEAAVVNKEHLQLTPEEAFFLVFALGALKVQDTSTRKVLSTKDLFSLLRQNSYFPPRSPPHLQPDDPFLIHYAVYHHFRSLGWVPRPGIKFGVDCEFLPPVT